MIPVTNLQMVRASTESFNFQIRDKSTGDPTNLTGGTLVFTAKWNFTDSDAAAVFQLSTPASGITIISAVNGTANVTIPDTATAALPYDVVYLDYDMKFTDGSGFPWTVMRGTLKVSPNVTRT